MKYTSAEAAKLLRRLNEEHEALLELERQSASFVAAVSEDLESIRELLASSVVDTEISGQVGLRNVRQRLELLYGQAGRLNIEQSAPERILAQVRFPIET